MTFCRQPATNRLIGSFSSQFKVARLTGSFSSQFKERRYSEEGQTIMLFVSIGLVES